ncbi:hypothetical protein CEUSTIGMA_g10325.t1 [Chlamydomonas eustigma]|uniref:F-box domain-containing protein n=1 Tax=Chlamydomonas eustigma TaxID=1157962 RepID=A0A250XJ03_9CHLO|nr:hypothetical protein CEUSTIGMA_g10325.t1 [Chlamydomonas eustigma]|eukprot:GAX82899.1 hypothetical protein CEUSTIGMA_g10325.t1 [Chlamydomonas eustigma]
MLDLWSENQSLPVDMQAHFADTVGYLRQLPVALLQNYVLPRLPPKELFCLMVCSKFLQEVVRGSESVWIDLADKRGWTLEEPQWKNFSSLQARCCVDCFKPSRYQFVLLGCRLCERCEHQSRRYALVTHAEAVESMGASEQVLESLPSVHSCGLNLYLRSQVQACTAIVEVETEEDSENAESFSSQEEDEQAMNSSFKKTSKGVHNPLRGQKAGLVFFTASPLSSSSMSKKAARRQDRELVLKQQQRPRRTDIFPLDAASRDVGGHSNKALRGRRGKDHERADAARYKRSQGLDSMPGGLSTSSAACKKKSGWMAEREQAMAEWGAFALSGLVLTDA